MAFRENLEGTLLFKLNSNKMAQIWNNLKLNNSKSIAWVRASALVWYWKNPQS